MKPATVVTAVLIFASSWVRTAAQHTAESEPIRAERQILKSIVRITVEAQKREAPGGAKKDPKAPNPERVVRSEGTGFLVGVPDERLKDRNFTYLVTNRHVAQSVEQDEHSHCTPLTVLKTYVTMNLKTPLNSDRAEQVPLELTQDNHWYFPDDEASDLAVMPFGVKSKYDFVLIMLDDFLGPERLRKDAVVPGEKVLTAGFFHFYAGTHEFQPLLREGVLAMFPDGVMYTTTCKRGDIYLADVHVIPGNSGSPIFIIPGLPMNLGTSLGGAHTTFGLLGVVSGYMQETEDLSLRASTTWQASAHSNTGIATVVPAQQLKDLLLGPKLKRLRDETVTRLKGSEP